MNPAAGAGKEVVVLLLAGGLLAFGMPRVGARDRRRFWHPWVNSGVLPLVLGLAVGPGGMAALDGEAAERCRPLLLLALAGAGLLAGTQLRLAWLRAAGRTFIVEHLRSCSLVLALAVPPLVVLLAWRLGWPGVALGLSLGSLALATSQRPPREGMRRRELAEGHTVPAGFWNLLALAVAGLALGLGPAAPAALLPAALMGAGLAVVATLARARDEAFLALIAVLALAGGLALALGSSPLLTGLAIGTAYANVGDWLPGRSSDRVERAIDELEQPFVIACALLAGVCSSAAAAPIWAWAAAGMALILRWSVRRRWSPTRIDLARGRQRRFATPGAAGILVVAALAAAQDPAAALVLPAALMLTLATLAHELVERPA